MTTNIEHLTVSLNSENCSGQVALPLWKRTLDLFCLLISLPITLPLGLCIAAYIKLTSQGPVIFRQERVGHRGRRFTCFKFRTMRVNTEVASHQRHLNQIMCSDVPMTKLDAKGDPRLIPGGAILRAAGLDELPQLINVLQADMSLVGPRPCVPYEYEVFSAWDKQRCEAMPGLTGLWQVNGKNKTTFRQMIALDIEYSRTKSLGLDLAIMFKTFSALKAQVRETREVVAVNPVLMTAPDATREAA